MAITEEQATRIMVESKYGDYTTIGGKHGLKADTVRRIARGKRVNDAVVASFIDLLDTRKGEQPQA